MFVYGSGEHSPKASACGVLLAMFGTFVACEPHPNNEVTIPTHDNERMFGMYIADWNSLALKTYTDAGSFWLLSFKNDSIAFDFNASCGCQFKAIRENERIMLLWPPFINCPFDLKLQESSGQLVPYDSLGVFAIVSSANDTTLHIEYSNASWLARTNEANREWIDSLFPTTFHPVEL